MTKLIFIALLLVSSQAVSANQGEVCTEKQWTETNSQMEFGLDNTDVYNCPTLGDVNIPQIYQKGWRVVLVDASVRFENQTQRSFSKHTLLIEKPE